MEQALATHEKEWLVASLKASRTSIEWALSITEPLIKKYALTEPLVSSKAHASVIKLRKDLQDVEQQLTEVTAIPSFSDVHGRGKKRTDEPGGQAKATVDEFAEPEHEDLGLEGRDDSDRGQNQPGQNDTSFTVSL